MIAAVAMSIIATDPSRLLDFSLMVDARCSDSIDVDACATGTVVTPSVSTDAVTSLRRRILSPFSYYKGLPRTGCHLFVISSTAARRVALIKRPGRTTRAERRATTASRSSSTRSGSSSTIRSERRREGLPSRLRSGRPLTTNPRYFDRRVLIKGPHPPDRPAHDIRTGRNRPPTRRPTYPGTPFPRMPR